MGWDNSMRWDAVLGYHLNGNGCGVARFNGELARRLGIPHASVVRDATRYKYPLVSVKVEELRGDVFDVEGTYDVLYHGATDAVLSRWAQHVYHAHEWGCPAVLTDTRELPDVELSLLSFGMAHKIRTDCYEQLADLVKKSGKSYALYVSAALHEGHVWDGRFADAIAELERLFDGKVYWLGSLSDVALYNELLAADYCACFFTEGVQANNTSVHLAMQVGAAVITNLGDGSPDDFRHGQTMLDIAQLVTLPDDLSRKRLALAARRMNAEVFSWDAFMRDLGAKSA